MTEEKITDRDFVSAMLSMLTSFSLDEGFENEIFYMDEFNDVFAGDTLLDIATKISFSSRYGWEGHVFNTGDEYFAFQGDGNIISVPGTLMKQYLCEHITMDFKKEKCEEYIKSHYDPPTAEALIKMLPFDE